MRFIKSLELSGVTVAGHSMGGAVALETAIKYPDELDGLVLIGSGARLRVNSEIFQGLEADFEATAAQLVRWCYGSGSSDKLLKWGLEQLLAERPEVILDDFRACNEFNRLDQISGTKQPAVVICGREDTMTPPEYSQYLAEHLQRATLRIIDGAGHMVMVENPFKVGPVSVPAKGLGALTVRRVRRPALLFLSKCRLPSAGCMLSAVLRCSCQLGANLGILITYANLMEKNLPELEKR
jgi:pimeloyl-ACP methyl ester carboxylesterase